MCVRIYKLWPECEDFRVKTRLQGAIKITKNSNRQTVHLDWASICVVNERGFPYGNKIPRLDALRLTIEIDVLRLMHWG